MVGNSLRADGRSISELYGTVLVISLAFLTAIAIIAMGLIILEDTTKEADDRMAQDAMFTLEERLRALTDSSVDEAQTWSPPEGTASQFESDPEAGSVTIEVRTTDEYWEATEPGGSLVDATQQRSTATVDLGTITHESESGILTVYQGGGLIRVEDGSVSVLREPDVEVSQHHMALNFVNISAMPPITEGGELVAQKEAEQVDTSEVQRIVGEAMERDGTVVAEAEINLTVTSEYAEGWAAWGRNLNTTDRSYEVWTHEDLPGELAEDQVKLGFGTFGDGISLPDEADPYDADVIYTGYADFAPDLYDDNAGELAERDPGFVVLDPSQSHRYAVGIRYAHEDQHQSWWTFDSDEGNWVNVEDPGAPPLAPTEPDAVESRSSDEFGVRDETWTCVVETHGNRAFADYVDTPGAGCLDGPVGLGDDDPDDHVADLQPFLEVTDFDTKRVPEDGEDGQLEVGTHRLRVDGEITNTGRGDAVDQPVALVVQDAERTYVVGGEASVDIDAGESKNVQELADRWIEPEYVISEDQQMVSFTPGVGTPDDGELGDAWTVVREETGTGFDVEALDIDEGSPADPIIEGEPLTGEVTVRNYGDEVADQELMILDDRPQQGIVETVTVQNVPPGGTVSKEFTWQTAIGDAAVTELTARTISGNASSAAVDIQPVDEEFSEFTVESVTTNDPVEEEETVTVTAEVENQGETDEQTVLLRDSAGTLLDGQTLELADGETDAVTLTWETAVGDAPEEELTVETQDDANATVVEVEPVDRDVAFDLTITDAPDAVEAGDDVRVEADVTNTGTEDAEPDVWLRNFDGRPVDAVSESIPAGATVSVELVWHTDATDVGSGDLAVETGLSSATHVVEVLPSGDSEANLEFTTVGTNSPVTEGETLNVTVDVRNTGDVQGSPTIVLEDTGGSPVDMAEPLVGADETETVRLTWHTIVGDAADPGDGDVTVTMAEDAVSTPVVIEEIEELRDPVDVMFVLDETGSMGSYSVEEVLSIDSGVHTVPDGPDREIWATQNEVCGWWCWWETDRYFLPGETVDLDAIEYDRLVRLDPYDGYDRWGDRVWAARAALDGLNETMGDRAGALEFDTDQTVYQPVSNDLGGVRDALRIDPGGSTDVAGGIDRAEEELLGLADPNDQVMIVLTDGIDNTGADPVDRAQEVDEDVTIYTVGFGGASEEDLRTIAEEGGSGEGEFFWADDAGELEAVFDDVINEVTEPKTPEFTVDVQSAGTDETVSEGATATVTVDLENVGEADGERVVTLSEDLGDTRNVVDSTTVSIPQGETATTNLEWETELDGGTDPPATGDLVVTTPSDEATTELTVEEGAQSHFAVSILGTNAPIDAGTTLEVSVEVTNTDDLEETQTIWLEDFAGNPVDTADRTLAHGETDSAVLEWDTDLGDAGTAEIRVVSDDDADSRTVEIHDGTMGDVSFDVTDLETNADVDDGESITAGEELSATATVTNTGSDDGQQFVELRDFDGETVAMSDDPIGVDAGATVDVDLSWATRPGDSPEGDTGDVAVVTRDDARSQEVRIEPPEGPDSEFQIASLGTNADDGVDSIEAGEDTLEVIAEIENAGTEDDSAIVELRTGDGEFLTLAELSVGAGATETVTLTYETDAVDHAIEEVELKVREASEHQAVDIRRPPTAADVSIASVDTDHDSRSDAVTAGEALDVDVVVENDLDRSVNVFLYSPFATAASPDDFETVAADSTSSVTLTWETSPGEGSDVHPREVTVQAEDVIELAEVYVDEAPDTIIDGPGTGEESNPVGIDIDEIAISD